MNVNNAFIPVVLIVVSIFTVFGCGGDAKKPTPPDTDDLMLMEKIVGTWDVISVNEMQPARFLTVLMVMDLKASDDGIAEEAVVPAAPIGGGKEGEFVDLVEDETDTVYQVKAEVDDFHYTFNADTLWRLHVQFDILPNDEAPPIDEVSAASDPGEGGDDPPPPDPNKPAAPAANGTNEAIGVVVGTWSGTYSIKRDELSLTVDAEDVKVTPHPGAEAFWQEISDAMEADAKTDITDKFRNRLITPFSKTFISIDDDGRLILTVPGSSHGKMILEKR